MSKARRTLAKPKAKAAGGPKPDEMAVAERALLGLDWFMRHQRMYGVRIMLEDIQMPENALRVPALALPHAHASHKTAYYD